MDELGAVIDVTVSEDRAHVGERSPSWAFAALR